MSAADLANVRRALERIASEATEQAQALEAGDVSVVEPALLLQGVGGVEAELRELERERELEAARQEILAEWGEALGIDPNGAPYDLASLIAETRRLAQRP